MMKHVVLVLSLGAGAVGSLVALAPPRGWTPGRWTLDRCRRHWRGLADLLLALCLLGLVQLYLSFLPQLAVMLNDLQAGAAAVPVSVQAQGAGGTAQQVALRQEPERQEQEGTHRGDN
jgi:hypothetical protein